MREEGRRSASEPEAVGCAEAISWRLVQSSLRVFCRTERAATPAGLEDCFGVERPRSSTVSEPSQVFLRRSVPLIGTS